jgi:hypothetical protein
MKTLLASHRKTSGSTGTPDPPETTTPLKQGGGSGSPRSGVEMDDELCELCGDESPAWTGHGWFCQRCIKRVVRKFRTGLLP